MGGGCVLAPDGVPSRQPAHMHSRLHLSPTVPYCSWASSGFRSPGSGCSQRNNRTWTMQPPIHLSFAPLVAVVFASKSLTLATIVD